MTGSCPECGHRTTLIAEARIAAPAPASEAVAQSVTIDFKQATELLEMFGDEPCEITLTAYPKDEHHFEEGFTIAAGLYAHYTECPEEGGNYLGVADHDAVPAGDSADAPVQQAGGERMSFEKAMVAAGYNKPERGAHANSGYLYQRDEDRFVGWELRAALKGEQPAEPYGSEQPSADLIEAAAKAIAQCMDYPWEPMPEQGRENMRKHARTVAAVLNAGPQPTYDQLYKICRFTGDTTKGQADTIALAVLAVFKGGAA